MAISKIPGAGVSADTLEAGDLAPNSVDSSELVDGSIDASHISNDAVGTAQLANDVAISTSGAIAGTGGLTIDGATVFNEASADVDFRVESNGNANMLVVDAGNDRIGIGTATPETLLHLESSLTIEPTIKLVDTNGDGAGPQLYFKKAGGSAADNDEIGRIRFDAQNDADQNLQWFNIIAYLSDASDGAEKSKMSFVGREGGGEVVPMNINGSIVSIGNGVSTLTDCQLELKQTGSTDAGIRINSEGTSRQSRLHIRSAANRINTDTGRILFESGTTTCAVIQAIQGGASNRCGIEFWPANGSSASLKAKVDEGGDFYTNDGSISSLSDSRAKKDVEDLEDGLDLLVQLRPVSFKYNGKTKMNDDDTHYGFIADEVQSIAPQYVKEKSEEFGSWSDGVFTKEEMLTDFKTLSTTRMIPMMLKAIQELSAKVTALENA